MAIDTINIGSAPNDGTGDPLRTAFNKTNTNFLNITADGGDEITVLNPTTSTDTTLNVALQDVFDAGGGAVSSVNGQTGAVSIDLESVLTEGNVSAIPIEINDGGGNYSLIEAGAIGLDNGTKSLTQNVNEFVFAEGVNSLIVSRPAILTQVSGIKLKETPNPAVEETLAFMSDITGVSDGDKGDITVSSGGTVWTIDNGAVSLAKTSGVQAELVSGTNIKTINGTSVLGSGDISIGGIGATQNARATRLELTNNISLPISPTGSVTVIDFDNSIFNVDPTVFTNNGAGTVTCTLAGNYLVTTSIVLESPLASAITKSELGIRKNSSTVVCATTDDTPIALGNNIRSLTTSTIINLAANDTLQAVVNLFGASATGQALRLPALFGTTATQVSNISIERLEVSEFDVDSTIIDGSANAVSGNAVFDGLALKANKPSFMILSSPYVGSSGTSLQKLFNVGSGSSGAFNASANKTYEFMCEFNLTAMSSTSGTFSFGFLGTAGIASVSYEAIASKASSTLAGTANATIVNGTTASAVVLVAATTNTVGKARITGTIRTSTSGTIIPAFAVSVSATPQVEANSKFTITELGVDTVTNSSDIS